MLSSTATAPIHPRLISWQMHAGIVAWTDKSIRSLIRAHMADNIFKVCRTYLCRSTEGLDLFCKPISHGVSLAAFAGSYPIGINLPNSALNLFSIHPIIIL